MAGEISCEKCNKTHDVTFGSGRFCSKSCAMSRNVDGSNNPMYGKTCYQIWSKKYGSVEAGLRLEKQTQNKVGKGTGPRPEYSKRMTGVNNPMFGKHHTEAAKLSNSEKHKGIKQTEEAKKKKSIVGKNSYLGGRRSSPGCSIKGYWIIWDQSLGIGKRLFFGSTAELNWAMKQSNPFLIERGPTVKYQHEDGSWHSHLVDYFVTGVLVEVKCKGHILTPKENLKKLAGEKYGLEHKNIYKVVFEETIPKIDIFILRKHLMIELEKKYEDQYQKWYEKRVK